MREKLREGMDCVMSNFHVSARNRPSDVGTMVVPLPILTKDLLCCNVTVGKTQGKKRAADSGDGIMHCARLPNSV